MAQQYSPLTVHFCAVLLHVMKMFYCRYLFLFNEEQLLQKRLCKWLFIICLVLGQTTLPKYDLCSLIRTQTCFQIQKSEYNLLLAYTDQYSLQCSPWGYAIHTMGSLGIKQGLQQISLMQTCLKCYVYCSSHTRISEEPVKTIMQQLSLRFVLI